MQRPRLIAPLLILACAAALACAGCGAGGSHASRTTSPTSGASSTTAPPARGGDWLGLNHNSSDSVGSLTEFSRVGIAWDRSGALEVDAGQTVVNTPAFDQALRRSLGAGMIPDIVVDPDHAAMGCSTNPDGSDLCVPADEADVQRYVRGFVATVASVRRAFAGRRIVFEPMDEPWNWAAPPGTTSGVTSARAYAAVIAPLLVALRAADVPLTVVYVPATGPLADGTQWIGDLYQAQPCLRPGPSSCGPIRAWNLHPYGPPDSTELGIRTVPIVRSQMASGADNIIISEMGFCASDVQGGRYCDDNVSQAVGTATQTAAWMRRTLELARPMHDAGWLRAVMFWLRTGGGWSIQLSGGQLTPQGQALVDFAHSGDG